MTYETHNLQADSEAFDRLVDGELSEAERRRLLSGLDAQTDGWRRCALAFLEAQAWRQACRPSVGDRALGDLPMAAPAPALRSAASSGGASGPWRWATPLALAASFLIGIALSVAWRPEGAAPPWPIDRPQQMATHERQPTDESVVAAAPHDTSAASDGLPSVAPSARVRLVWAGDAGESSADEAVPTQEVELPVMDSQELERSWGEVAAGLSNELLQRLGRMGHRVRVERQMVPVQMDDGGQAAVPVDRVNVIFVGNDYQ